MEKEQSQELECNDISRALLGQIKDPQRPVSCI